MQTKGGLKEVMVAMGASGEMQGVMKRNTFVDGDAIVDTKRKFSALCEEFVLSLGRTKVVPVVQQKMEGLEIEALDALAAAPSKEAIWIWHSSCKNQTRKQVRKQVVAAYNAAERKPIKLVGGSRGGGGHGDNMI